MSWKFHAAGASLLLADPHGGLCLWQGGRAHPVPFLAGSADEAAFRLASRQGFAACFAADGSPGIDLPAGPRVVPRLVTRHIGEALVAWAAGAEPPGVGEQTPGWLAAWLRRQLPRR